MTRRAVDEVFDAQNRADDAATAIQTLGKPVAEQDAGRAAQSPKSAIGNLRSLFNSFHSDLEEV